MGPQHGIWQMKCVKFEETWIKPGPWSSHICSTGVFLRHPRLNQKKESLLSHAQQERISIQQNWKRYVYQETPHRSSQPVEKCIQTKMRPEIWICSWRCSSSKILHQPFFVVISAKITVLHGVDRRSNTKSYPQMAGNYIGFLGLSSEASRFSSTRTPNEFSSQGLREATRREIQYDAQRHMNGYHEEARCETCQNEARCETCQNGCSLPESWWAQKLQPRNAKHVFFRNHVVAFLSRKRGSRKHNVFTHFPKDPNFEVSRRNLKLRGFRVEGAQKMSFTTQSSLSTRSRPSTQSSTKGAKRAILTGMQWLCRTWPLSGHKVTNAKQNL